MRTRPFGPSGKPVSILGQGTWRVRDLAATAKTLQEGIALGLTHIDTAELYEQQSGSETMLGELLSRPARAGGTLRDHVFLASKVLPRHGTRKGVLGACKDSLVRLQTDHVDLYYHHWRDGPTPLSETLRAIAECRDAGWVRMVGVSNYDVADLDEAESILGKGVLAANQVLYHLEDRGAESEVIPWCKTRRVAVVAYSPFGAGRWLTGPRLKRLEAIATPLGLTARQAALAFLAREAHVFPIPKTEAAERVRENAGGDVDLPREAVDAIDAAFQVRGGLRTI